MGAFLPLILWMGTLFFHHQMSLQPDLQKMKNYLVSPPPLVEHFTFGHDLIMSDLLWLKSIQNSDDCEDQKNKGDKGDSERGNKQSKNQSPSFGHGSWFFKMLDAITRLDPLYRVVYSLGGVALSILCEDKDGARFLFRRGMKHLPQDWSLYFKAAYHELYEMKDPTQAAHLFWEAGRLGAPKWVFLLAHRLFLKEGKKEVLIPFLHQLLKEGHQGPMIERLKQRILQKNTLEDID